MSELQNRTRRAGVGGLVTRERLLERHGSGALADEELLAILSLVLSSGRP